MPQGKAIIFSAPSGSGKTTIVQHLSKKIDQLEFSISATTRKPRKGLEEDGIHYHFILKEKFKRLIKEGGFVEWEEVYGGNYYGTLKSEIERIWSEGKTVIFDVDVKGGLNLKKYFGIKALAIFVKVPKLEVLKERLVKRKTESEADLKIRMQKATQELAYEPQFDVSLINRSLDESLKNAEDMVRKFIADS